MEVLKALLTPANIAIAVSGAVGLLGLLLGGAEVRRRRVALAVYHAFHIVEDIGREKVGDDVFDKAAAGLKAADDYMKANGWRALKPGEQEVALLGFKSLHGENVATA